MEAGDNKPGENMSKPLEEVKRLTIGQLAALVHKLGGSAAAEAILVNDTLAQKASDIIVRHMSRYHDTPWLLEWPAFYREIFCIDVDLREVRLPPGKPGFDQLIVVAKELGDKPICKTLSACRLNFGGDVYFGNDSFGRVESLINERDPRNGSYAIHVRDRLEADEENRHVYPEDFSEMRVATITLLERLIFELFYFWRFGLHLDETKATICSGSRFIGSRKIPTCGMERGCFEVHFSFEPDCLEDGDDFRVRSVLAG